MMETMAKVNLEGGAGSPCDASEARVASGAPVAMVLPVSRELSRLSDPTVSPKPSAPRRWLPLALLIAAILVVLATGAHRYLSLETIVANKARLERSSTATGSRRWPDTWRSISPSSPSPSPAA